MITRKAKGKDYWLIALPFGPCNNDFSVSETKMRGVGWRMTFLHFTAAKKIAMGLITRDGSSGG
jgi:hypothetical protein